MKTYEISPFWKYLSLAIIYSIYLGALYFLYPIYSKTEMNMFVTVIIPFAYFFLGIFLYSYLNSQFSLILVIDNEKIRQENDKIYKEWYFDEIKGFRVLKNMIILETNHPEKKALKLASYYDNYSEIETWIRARFKNLDKNEKYTERKEIKAIEKKHKNLKESDAKKITKTLNILAVIILIWMIFFKEFFITLAIYSSIVLFFICIFTLKKYKGIIKFIDNKNTISPSIGIALSLIPGALIISCILKYNFLDYSYILLYSGIIAFIILVIYFINEDYKTIIKKKFNLITLFFIAFAFGFGSIINLNAIHNQRNEYYNSKILNKFTSGGKTTSYIFTIDKWQYISEIKDVDISYDLYESKNIGDNISITYYEGFFKIPFYTVK